MTAREEGADVPDDWSDGIAANQWSGRGGTPALWRGTGPNGVRGMNENADRKSALTRIMPALAGSC